MKNTLCTLFIAALLVLFSFPTQAQQDKKIELNNVMFELIFVKGGTFKMGATPEQGDEAYTDEKPVQTVTLSDFYIGKYEVTIGQFTLFVEATGYKTDAETQGGSNIWDGKHWIRTPNVNWRCDEKGKPADRSKYNHPVVHVSWNDATAYCAWLSKQTGKKFSLPTEAQWEYAARGGNKSKGYKYSGSNNADEVAHYQENNGIAIRPVGQKRPNELEIYDMSGNVWEWCQDWHGDYRSAPLTNPKGAVTGSTRVRRGGSWFSFKYCCRVSDRYNSTPDSRYNYVGFRLALTP